MTSAAPQGGWRQAVVRETRHGMADGVMLRLEVADRVDHLPGQHYVIRLTAEDGYTASRSYSIASAPGDPLIELFVQKLPDGEVSGFLADEVRVGDELEVRGPIGGWFVWDGQRPAVGIGGGSGVVPLVAMLRHAATLGRPERLRLVVAARNRELLPYADELTAAGATVAYSRTALPSRPAGRLGSSDLAPLLTAQAAVFVCGSAGFATSAERLLAQLGVPPERTRFERFGPTG